MFIGERCKHGVEGIKLNGGDPFCIECIQEKLPKEPKEDKKRVLYSDEEHQTGKYPKRDEQEEFVTDYERLWSVAKRVLRDKSSSTNQGDNELRLKRISNILNDSFSEVRSDVKLTEQDKKDIFHDALETIIKKDLKDVDSGYFGGIVKNKLREHYWRMNPRRYYKQRQDEFEKDFFKVSTQFNLRYYFRPEDKIKEIEEIADLQDKTGELFPVALKLLQGYSRNEISKQTGIHHEVLKRELAKVLK